jgi:5'-3' exonuclease
VRRPPTPYRALVTRRLLLDVSSLMFRAFFSVPASVAGRDGRPVNAVHGYLDMCARLLAAREPDETVHVFDDDWRPAPRVTAYAGYKANRPPDPEGLPPQFELLREVLAALGAAHADAPGWEADDAMGAICATGRAGDRFDIVTGDRDLIQLVHDPGIRVLFTVKGVSDLRVLDEAGVLAKYGVSASRYADFATLRGDPSDGLPGVRGVGEKTARALVETYPSIQAIVDDASAQKRAGGPLQRSPALRAAIRDAAAYLAAMRSVVPIRTDVEVRLSDEAPDDDLVDALVGHHRLQGPVTRLRAALRARADPVR